MRRDDAYLLDILIEARRAQKFVAGLTLKQFLASDLHQYAAMKALETIGEAASKISKETQQAHPEIPWANMIGMRHRLIHDYPRVNLQKVWETIQDYISPLIAQIEPLVPPEEP